MRRIEDASVAVGAVGAQHGRVIGPTAALCKWRGSVNQLPMTLRSRALLAAFIILAATAAILLAMGRPPICTCGEIALWEPSAASPRTSQMLADWYSPSHLVHGFLFYAGSVAGRPRLAGRAALPRRIADRNWRGRSSRTRR